jgi:hypothetical protein
VLYQCLTGDTPFDREDEAAMLWAHLVEHAPRVSARRPGLPPGVDAVVARAMAKAPEDRYGACRDLIADFRDEVEGGAGSQERRPGTAVDRPSGPPAGGAPNGPPPGNGPRRRQPSRSATMSSDRVDSALAGFVARRSRGTLALAAVVLLVVVVAAVLFVRGRNGGLDNAFARDNLVPFSFRYPGGWQQETQGNQAVFSPHASEALQLFSSLGGGDSWTQVGALTDRAPSEMVGLFTFFNTTRVDTETVDQIQVQLRSLLPPDTRFSSARDRLVVGGFAADRLEGDLREPGGQDAVLRFQCYLVHVQPPDAKSVYLVFFSSDATFDGNRKLFERITESVDFLT